VSGAATGYLGELAGQSQIATWTCTADPCPWGQSLGNHALAWPAVAGPVATRLGYTVSPAVYLPADHANGIILSVEFGSAGVFAGRPAAPSHRFLVTVSAGQRYEVAGLPPGEVLSVQSDDVFRFRVTTPDAGVPDAGVPDAGVPDAGAPDAGAPDAGAPDAGAPDAGAPDAGAPDDGASVAGTSQVVTWTCARSPCPWGDSLGNPALVWPAEAGAITNRLGYTASAVVYLPAVKANGASISVDTGTANAYAGQPDAASHRRLASISAGQTYQVSGVASGEVVSVQADSAFTYRVALGGASGDGDHPIDAIAATQALWRCNVPECSGGDWTGAVINWPSWAAYHDNARARDLSRSVFAADDTPLYPYMGAWAQGCEVTAESGTVLIIEWQRGTDVWRETWLQPRQSHVIALVPPEDGAMIETFDGSPGFSVSLKNCTPQPLGPSQGQASVVPAARGTASVVAKPRVRAALPGDPSQVPSARGRLVGARGRTQGP